MLDARQKIESNFKLDIVLSDSIALFPIYNSISQDMSIIEAHNNLIDVS